MVGSAVRIRLSLRGCTNRPFFHLVVAPSKFKRDGRHLEQVGSFDPMPNYNKEKLIALNVDRIKYWLTVGAHPTKPVAKILGLAGILPVYTRTYLETARRKVEMEKSHAVDNDSDPSDSDPSDGDPSDSDPGGTNEV